ncbi:MAG: DUF4640 domain-containing protein [Planctomycetaceae bacterium]|nr:DUF4640 domain-containing protein [Planctomycetaceae bacterium]
MKINTENMKRGRSLRQKSKQYLTKICFFDEVFRKVNSDKREQPEYFISHQSFIGQQESEIEISSQESGIHEYTDCFSGRAVKMGWLFRWLRKKYLFLNARVDHFCVISFFVAF